MYGVFVRAVFVSAWPGTFGRYDGSFLFAVFLFEEMALVLLLVVLYCCCCRWCRWFVA